MTGVKSPLVFTQFIKRSNINICCVNSPLHTKERRFSIKENREFIHLVVTYSVVWCVSIYIMVFLKPKFPNSSRYTNNLLGWWHVYGVNYFENSITRIKRKAYFLAQKSRCHVYNFCFVLFKVVFRLNVLFKSEYSIVICFVLESFSPTEIYPKLSTFKKWFAEYQPSCTSSQYPREEHRIRQAKMKIDKIFLNHQYLKVYVITKSVGFSEARVRYKSKLVQKALCKVKEAYLNADQ